MNRNVPANGRFRARPGAERALMTVTPELLRPGFDKLTNWQLRLANALQRQPRAMAPWSLVLSRASRMQGVERR
jgi:hypothetical protein